MTTLTFNLNYRDPSTDLLTSNPVALPPSIASYDFNGSDVTTLSKGGFAWNQDRGPGTISTPSGQTEKGLEYKWVGSPDPRVQDNNDRYFTYSQMPEVWVKKRFFIPSNYFHRRCLQVTITADMSAWQVGDLVNDGGNTSKTATIYYKTGTSLFLLFAFDDYNTSAWITTITNVTRSQTLSNTRNGVLVDNNKAFVLFCDGYSSGGKSPTVVWEMRGDGLGGSIIYSHYAVDGNGTNFDSAYVPFIDYANDRGKWMDVIFHVKMASSEAAADGIIALYQRKQGAAGYTKILNVTDATTGPRAAATPTNCQFRSGYDWGYSNSGVAVDTTITESLYQISATAIDGVS